jgi:hypothetical protein
MCAGNAGVFYIQVNRTISTFGQESNATPQSRNKLVQQRSLHPGVGLRWHDTLQQQLQPLSPETTMSTILPHFSVNNKHGPRMCCSHRAIATEYLNKMFIFSWRSRKYISALHKSWKLAINMINTLLIHSSNGFLFVDQQKHELPWEGGRDFPPSRQYTRYCAEKIAGNYSDRIIVTFSQPLQRLSEYWAFSWRFSFTVAKNIVW